MKLDRRFSRFQKVVIGLGASVLSGALTLITGIFDPTFLLTNPDAWWGIGSMVSRFVGPIIVPELPWSAITLVLALTSIAVSLYKLDKNREVEG